MNFVISSNQRCFPAAVSVKVSVKLVLKVAYAEVYGELYGTDVLKARQMSDLNNTGSEI